MMHEPIRVACYWELRERDPKTGLIVARRRAKNVMTNDGLSALASAWQGTYANPPLYMVFEGKRGLIVGDTPAGSTQVTLDTQIDLAGDTQIILSPRQVYKETVGFSSVTFDGTNYIYTFTAPTTSNHFNGEGAVRQVYATDTMLSVQSEAQYDPTNFPGQRGQSIGGFSPAAGEWTMQFFFSSTQCIFSTYNAGLSDNPAVGSGLLHNHVLFPITGRVSGAADLEIDVTLTLSN